MQRTPIVTTAQMRALEQAAVDAGATWPGLMEQAGWGVAQVALRLLGGGRDRRALILVGPGNNGGDGLVVARHLHDAGALVTLYLWRRALPADDGNWQRCRQRGIAELHASDDPGQAALRAQLARADLVIDALLGMGTTRPVEGDLAALVGAVNGTRGQGDREIGGGCERLRPPLLSIDMPTGVCSDTGAILGAAIGADITVATGLPKRGLLLYPGRAYAGALALADIGVPPRVWRRL